MIKLAKLVLNIFRLESELLRQKQELPGIPKKKKNSHTVGAQYLLA